MKSWVIQRNEYDNGVAVVRNLLDQLGVRVTHTTMEECLYANPHYPSLAALEDVLKQWGFETLAAKVPCGRLAQVATPAIAFLDDSSEFILIMTCDDEKVTYIHPRVGWCSEDTESFLKKWHGVVLMADPGKASKEEDYDAKLKAEQIKKQEDPRLGKINIIDDFLSPKECASLIKLSKAYYRRSAIIKSGKAKISDHRTSFTALLDMNEAVVEKVYQRASEILQKPSDYFEPLQCTSYSKGQEYKAHYDAFEESNSSEILKLGQRMSTILIYLNENYEGGETYFPILDVRVQPKTGRALIFHNLDDEGDRDPEVYHAGLPVWSGTKYVSNLWVRDQPYQKIRRSLVKNQPRN